MIFYVVNGYDLVQRYCTQCNSMTFTAAMLFQLFALTISVVPFIPERKWEYVEHPQKKP